MSKRLQPIKLDTAINIIRSWQDTFNMMNFALGYVVAGLQQHQAIDKTRDAELKKYRCRAITDILSEHRCRARAVTVSFDTIIRIDNIVH